MYASVITIINIQYTKASSKTTNIQIFRIKWQKP